MNADAFGLSPRIAGLVRQILAAFPEVEKAVIYGSRAIGTHKPGSDIDLTLFGEGLTSGILGRIASRLDDSPIPHTIDLSLYAELNHAKLREHIDRVGVVFYMRGDAGPFDKPTDTDIERLVPERGRRGGWRVAEGVADKAHRRGCDDQAAE